MNTIDEKSDTFTGIWTAIEPLYQLLLTTVTDKELAASLDKAWHERDFETLGTLIKTINDTNTRELERAESFDIDELNFILKDISTSLKALNESYNEKFN